MPRCLHRHPFVRFIASVAGGCALAVGAAALAGQAGGHCELTHYTSTGGERRTVRDRADWARRRAQILAGMERAMGPLPRPNRRTPLDPRVEEEVRLGGLTRRRISFAADERHRVPAYLFLPETPKGRRAPAMLCLHQTITIGKAEPAGLGGSANLHYALELARRGYVTLAPDYPSFGDYSCAFDPADGWKSGTMRAVWDNVRAVDLLESLPEVRKGSIGVIGHSLGGHNSLFTAVFEPRIRAVVTSCGFTRFHRYYGGKLAGWTSPRYMPLIASEFGSDPDRVPFDFPEVIAAIAPRAVFASSPARDANFDVQGVRETVDACIPTFRLLGKTDALQVIYPDSEHDFPLDAREQAYAFLDRNLRR